MSKLLRYALLPLLLLSFAPAAPADTEAAPVLALRAFFTKVVNGDDKGAWSLFTRHTQDGIVKSVSDSEHMQPAELRSMFDDGDQRLHDGFWDSFHKSSQAESFISVQMDSTGPDKDAPGSVTVTLPNGAQLKMLMYLEGADWKVGWFETFFPSGQLQAPAQ
ncbi:MAG TPA: hypothetical protein VH327_02750 [Gammaproteobacteria bacterium]|jgi:hypothetical protein|nr:hypothetical protein [Gammaproteobacteria bacterium]